MIIIKSQEEIEKIRTSCRISSDILASLAERVIPGIRTIELENAAGVLMRDMGCVSAFKGYNGFPANICVSVNDAVVHGIPGGYRLKEGDIVSIDVGVLKNGYYGDVAGTFFAGEISKSDAALIRATKEALENSIAVAVPGKRLSDISHAVENTAKNYGFSVVRDFVGHGIGQEMHEDPQVPNFGEPGRGPALKRGMVLAIEPMLNAGTYKVSVDRDGWTVRTRDGKKSAHFEHTVAILDTGPDVLTRRF